MTATDLGGQAQANQSRRSFDVWFVRILAATAITLFSIQFSYQHRRLMLHPMADDSNYFVDALIRLNTYYANGPYELWRSLIHNPPHTPLSTILGAFAFAVFGRNEWAPYAANALIILALLTAVDWAAGSMATWQRLLLYCFVAGTQLPLIAVTEFRPDFGWAILLAFSIIFILRRPLIGATSFRQAMVGVFFGLCLFVKPSTFPLTVVLFGMATSLCIACDLLEKGWPGWRALLKFFAIGLAAAFVVAGPYYICAWRETYAYFYDNIYGSRKQLWEVQASLSDHLRYYLDGGSGIFTLGKYHFYILLGVDLVALGWMVCERRRRLRALSLVLIALAAYAIPTTSKVANPYFGAPLQVLLLLAAVYGLSRLLKLDRPKLAQWPSIVFALSCLASLAIFTPPILGSHNEPGVIASTRLGEQIYQMIKRRSIDANVFIPAPGTTVEGSTLRCMSMLDGTNMNFTGMEPSRWDDRILMKHWLDGADFVVTGDPGNTETMAYLPTGPLGLPLYLREVRARHDFIEFATLPTLSPDKVYHLFQQRPDPFTGTVGATGLGSYLGPFPTAHIPVVREAYWPRTRVEWNQPAAGKRILEMNGYTHQKGLTIGIFVDGKEIGLDAPPIFMGNDFAYFSYAIDLSAGAHVLELRYGYPPGAPKQSVPVLFKRLDIMPLD